MSSPRDKLFRSIVRAVASKSASSICSKVIAFFQADDRMLYGHGYDMESIWDEIVDQVKGEETIHWEVYKEDLRGVIRGYVQELPQHHFDAIWLQSQEGEAWGYTDPDEREPDDVLLEDVVYYVQGLVLRAAADWETDDDDYGEENCDDDDDYDDHEDRDDEEE